eukprot:scaffold98884_cov45-Attheya_sp.AAC.3
MGSESSVISPYCVIECVAIVASLLIHSFLSAVHRWWLESWTSMPCSVLPGHPDPLPFSLPSQSSLFKFLDLPLLSQRTRRTSFYWWLQRPQLTTCCLCTLCLAFLPHSKFFRLHILRIFPTAAPAPSAVSPSLFNNAVLPHLPGEGNAFSRLDDSLQAQQGQIPSAQGQSFSHQAVPTSNGAYPNAYPQAQEFMASRHSTVPVPPPAPGGRTFTDAQIMELITNARQVHQPSATRQYTSAHSMPHPSLPSVVCVGLIYHSTASLPAPHSSQASTVPLNPSVNNVKEIKTLFD